MDRDDLEARFEWFADWCVGTSPLYERLSRTVAADPYLLDLAAETPEGRSPAHLLLASAHFLLLAGRDGALADFYPTDPAETNSTAIDPAETDPAPAFREFCSTHADEIRDLLARRRTQTNSVRRCAALLPAFEAVSRRADRAPLSLVEVGPSAGLNLLWDRYGYDYGDYGDAGRYGDSGRYGDPDSPVLIESRVRDGDPPLPDDLPPVASRVGVDVNPIDVTDPADARWLRALVWPEHDERHRLLRAGLEVARETPPDLREGDALELLPDVVAEIPADRPICLFDTQVRYQLDEADRERFDALIADLGADRELYSVSGDESSDEYEQAVELTLTTVGDGLETERLGSYQQHGEWVAWEGI